MTTPAVEVIHIVYKPFGPEPLERFLTSYRCHEPGTAHSLTLACKGFEDEPDALATWRPADLPHRALIVPNQGFDIGTYFHVARQSSADLLCFLNSRSVILGERWLAKLVEAWSAQGGGVVGATGSWQSFASDPSRPDYPLTGARWTHVLRRRYHAIRAARLYPRFANAHLRTNAILLSRKLLLRLNAREPADKADALLFESGKNSLTRQVLAQGLLVRIVDHAGRVWAPEDWALSETFFAGEQANLLIADNQTERYIKADPKQRDAMYRYAWCAPGEHY